MPLSNSNVNFLPFLTGFRLGPEEAGPAAVRGPVRGHLLGREQEKALDRHRPRRKSLRCFPGKSAAAAVAAESNRRKTRSQGLTVGLQLGSFFMVLSFN